jgi:hypothetical protein
MPHRALHAARGYTGFSIGLDLALLLATASMDPAMQRGRCGPVAWARDAPVKCHQGGRLSPRTPTAIFGVDPTVCTGPSTSLAASSG